MIADHLFGQVLLRLIDDYLFVTTDLKQAQKFLHVMHRGIVLYIYQALGLYSLFLQVIPSMAASSLKTRP
jgi:hypothetical protein